MTASADIPNLEKQPADAAFRERFEVAEETLQAIKRGEVEALVAHTAEGMRLFTLPEANPHFRVFIEEMQQGAATLSEDGTILYCNRALPTILKTPADQVIGVAWQQFVAPESKVELGQLLNQAATERAQAELTLSRGDGGRIPALVAIERMFEKGLATTCLVVTDLSERKRAEEIRRRLEDILQTTERRFLGRKGSVPVGPVGESSRNRPPNALKKYGLAVLAVVVATLVRSALWPLLGNSTPFLLHWPAIIVAAWYGGFRAGFVATLLSALFAALFLLDPPYSLTISAPGEQFGLAVFLFLGTGLSLMLERARGIERSHLRAVAEMNAIRAASAYNRTLIETSLDPLVTIGPEGKITDVNTATEKLTGLHREQLIGTDFADYFTDPASARAGCVEAFRTGSIHNYALEMRHCNGSRTPVLYNATPYRDEAGRVVGVFAAARDMSEQQRAQDALRESEAAFRTMVESIPQLVWMCNPEGLNLFFNRQWVEYTGLTREETAGTRWSTAFHPDDRDRAQAAWAVTVATGGATPYQLECRLRRADGAYRWFLIKGVPLRGAANEIIKWFGTCTDIDDLKRADERLRASESRFRTIFEEAPLGVAVIDSLTARFYEVNPRFAAIAGRSREEFATLDWICITHPDDMQEVLDNMAAMNAGPIPGFTMRKRYLRPDGSFVWIQMSIAPLKVEDKSQPRHLCMIEDITERLRLEDERTRAHEQLQRERRRLHDMLNVIPINICLLTPDYHIPFANEAFEKCFGRSGGRRCYEALFGWDTPCPFCESFRPLTSGHPHRWRFAGPNGRIYDVYDFPFTDADGSPLILEVELDITEQEKRRELLEQRVNERTAELQAANKELESFSYSVSHDLRAPLRAIDGFSRIVQEEYGAALPPAAQDALAEVRAAHQKMGRLIDDLLAFSRLGRQSLCIEVVEPAELVAEVRRQLQPILEGRKVEWTIGSLPPCWADRNLLRQVILNLLDNAVKYTRPRDPALIEIGTRAGDPPGETVYFVKDNGVGFDMQYAHKLFGVFQRLHSSTEFEGTGVGLALAQRILHRHGGHIWAEATVDHGATFFFTLPARGAP